MEKEKDDTKPYSATAIRCAKAAMLLHSVRNRRQQQEKERMKERVEELKMELVKERFMRRNLKTCNLIDFSLLIVLLFSIFTYFVLISFKN